LHREVQQKLSENGRKVTDELKTGANYLAVPSMALQP
jgi:hypothetical protein